jgi:hypothetical protein
MPQTTPTQPHIPAAAVSAADASRGIVSAGADAWPLWLFEFVDDLRRTRDPALIEEPPAPELAARLRALLASTTEAICAECGLDPPDLSIDTPPLDRPWFVAGIENLKASPLVESPARFRRRNIFVLGNFLDRA